MNFRYTSASRCRAVLSKDEKHTITLALATLEGQNFNSNLPEEIVNHVNTTRRKVRKTVKRALTGDTLGEVQKEVLVATLHWGKTLE